MSKSLVKPKDTSEKREVEIAFKHGSTQFEKGKTYSFSQGALKKYSANLKKVVK